VPIRQLTLGGSPAVALRGSEVEVVVVPSEGARIAHLRRPAGREWLRGGGGGGWRESLMVTGVGEDASAATDAWQDAPWEHTLLEHPQGVTLASRAILADRSLELQRELTIDPHVATVRMLYAVRHGGTTPLHWIWGIRAAWTSRAGTLLHLPGVTQVQVTGTHGRPDLDAGDLVSWPGAIGGDASRFRVSPDQAWTVTCGGDLGAPGRITIVDPDREERLEMRTDIARVPHVVVELLGGGGDDLPPGICVAPHIGVPHQLEAAILAGTAARLVPGEERSWGVELRLVDPERDDLPDGP
jgi:hypothetical protein